MKIQTRTTSETASNAFQVLAIALAGIFSLGALINAAAMFA